MHHFGKYEWVKVYFWSYRTKSVHFEIEWNVVQTVVQTVLRTVDQTNFAYCLLLVVIVPRAAILNARNEARFKRRTFHVPNVLKIIHLLAENLIYCFLMIQHIKSSTFETGLRKISEPYQCWFLRNIDTRTVRPRVAQWLERLNYIIQRSWIRIPPRSEWWFFASTGVPKLGRTWSMNIYMYSGYLSNNTVPNSP